MKRYPYIEVKLAHLAILMLLFFNIHGYSQNKKEHLIDSLKQCIEISTNDTAKINAYKAWDDLIYISDPKLDEELNQKIVALAQSNLIKESFTRKELLFYKKSLALALNSLGIITYTKGESSKALDYYYKSLHIRQELNDKKGIAATLNNIGIVFQEQAEHNKAIDYYTQSLKISEQIGDKNSEANCLSNIGRIYRELKDTVKAIDYQTRSLEIRQAIKDKRGVAIAYSNLGSLYSDMDNNSKALMYFEKALAVTRELGDKNKIAFSLSNIGFIHKKRNENKEAIAYFKESLQMFEETGSKKLIAATLVNIGDVYKQKGEITTAIPFYKRALPIAKEGHFVSVLKDVSEALTKAYRATNNLNDALVMQDLYYQMRDSILNETNQKEVFKQEFKYNYDKQKAIDDKEHEKQLAVSEERDQKLRIAIYLGTGIIILILGFTFFALNRLRLSRRQNTEINKQKDIVEEKQKEIMASFTYAKRLQDGILPSENYIKSLLPESFVLYKPKDIVAGDFYWLERKSDRILFAVGDSTGHGIPGAIISVICSNALNMAVMEFGITDPGKILDKTREIVLENFSKSGADVKDGMDISLLSIDLKLNEVEWSGANNPLWYISQNQFIEIKANKQSIGKTDNPLPFTTHSIKYKKGDVFYLFTDGYPDQFGGPDAKKLKYKALKEILVANSNHPLESQKRKLNSTFEKWRGDLEQVDDVTIVGVRL
jgi:serine phosphatase RsbU (regulator of sigma subunit)/Tfp pilus assembly protein PilF